MVRINLKKNSAIKYALIAIAIVALATLSYQNIKLDRRLNKIESMHSVDITDPNYEILTSIGLLHSDISEENYEIMIEALKKFDPQLRRYLALIPFIKGNVRTAAARTRSYEPPLNVFNILSNDWDNTYGESYYWEIYEERGENPNQPIFPEYFKLDLFTHEYLHHAELRKGINIKNFYADVTIWYNDLNWGEATSDENYIKFIVYWNVYGGNGTSIKSKPGREEFAYIGERIANGIKERNLKELPPYIIAYYDGILREDLLR